MLNLKRQIGRDLRLQIDNALSREGLSFAKDSDAVNALVNAYHGYKNAYEAMSGSRPAASPPVTEPEIVNRPSTDRYYRPIFEFDGLATDPKIIHNHDFMRDPAFIDAYAAGADALQLDHKMYWRLHVVLYFANRGLALDGDFVECGVWRGFLSAAIAQYTNWSSVNKTFYLFDTFDGLAADHLSEAEVTNAEKVAHLNKYFKDSYSAAKTNFARYPDIKLIKGAVPETLGTVDIDRVAYLSIDMNCVAPEIAAAEFFWDRLVPSAPIILDDYGFVSYEEQKRAFNDFAKHRGVEVLHLPTGQGVILKP